ncbi:hypothetical protein ACFLY6_02230 [Candidatus Dependentiae bacterium]
MFHKKSHQKGLLILILAYFTFGPNKTKAASTMMHAYIAHMFLEECDSFTKKQKTDFILGNLFPDIQKLAKNKVKTFHFTLLPRGTELMPSPPTIKDVTTAQTPFMAGIMLHSFVDNKRNYLLKEGWKKKALSETDWLYLSRSEKEKIKSEKMHPILEKLKKHNNKHNLLKFVEDEILFSKLPDTLKHNDWNILAIDPIPEETRFVAQDKVLQWRHLTDTQLRMTPGEMFSLISSSGLSDAKKSEFGRSCLKYSDETLQEWSEILPELAEDKEIQEHTWNLIKQFKKEFDEHSKNGAFSLPKSK